MTQHQLINQLQDIMPEIVETKNPRATMIKCAKKNNLSIAQLEKLGQVFNTYKTLVGLEKQATRGGSFSIVDVPDMVAEYATYTPSEPTTKKQLDVHAQINSWLNDADSAPKSAALEWIDCFSTHTKAASAKKLPSVYKMLDEHFKGEGGVEYHDYEQGRQWHEEELDYINKPEVLHKAASAEQEQDPRKALKLLKEASDNYEELLFNAQENMRRIGNDIVSKMRQDALDWEDVAYDLHDRFREKAATAVNILEDVFKQANYKTPHVALEKRGYYRSIPANKYGMYDQVDELLKTAALYETAREELVDVLAEKQAAMTSIALLAGAGKERLQKEQDHFFSSISDKNGVLYKALKPAFNVDEVKEKALASAKNTGALQQLILSDPVLQQADPAELEDLFHTISDLAPTIAQNPITVAPVLKEALQYGSLPIQQVKDLISAEKDFQNTQKYKLEAEKLQKGDA